MVGCPRHSIANVMEGDPLLLSSESADTYLADIQMRLGLVVSIIFLSISSVFHFSLIIKLSIILSCFFSASYSCSNRALTQGNNSSVIFSNRGIKHDYF